MKSRFAIGLAVLLVGLCTSIATACPRAASLSVQAFVPTVAVTPFFATTTAVAFPLAVNIGQESCFVGRQSRRLAVFPSAVNVSVRAVNRRPIRAFARPVRTRVRVLVR